METRDFDCETLELVAQRFKVSGETTRLQILNALRSGESTVTDLVQETGVGQANLSKHLAILHRQGLVARRKEGLFTWYRIADPLLFHLCELVCDSLENRARARHEVFTRTKTRGL